MFLLLSRVKSGALLLLLAQISGVMLIKLLMALADDSECSLFCSCPSQTSVPTQHSELQHQSVRTADVQQLCPQGVRRQVLMLLSKHFTLTASHCPSAEKHVAHYSNTYRLPSAKLHMLVNEY